MNINIVAVGGIKEKFYRDAIDEYAKRLSRYAKATRSYAPPFRCSFRIV